MKNTIFINSNLSNNFEADIIDLANYLQNQLLTSYANNKKIAIILKEQ